jgi:hypothetical protein
VSVGLKFQTTCRLITLSGNSCVDRSAIAHTNARHQHVDKAASPVLPVGAISGVSNSSHGAEEI